MAIVGESFDRLAAQVREDERDRDCVNSHRPLTAAPDVTRERLMPTIVPRRERQRNNPRRRAA